MNSILDTSNLAEITQSGLAKVRANPFVPIALEELPMHVMQAFDNPLDYPSLSNATVPGDRVAIAVQQGVPQAQLILAGTLAALSRSGVELEQISVIVPSHQKRLQSELQKAVGSEVSVGVHTTDESEQLALLGVTEAGLPLRLNRVLCDADLVISIGPALGEHRFGSSATRIFPAFSDQETLKRFQTPRNFDTVNQIKSLAQESERCDWLLGLGLSLEVVPAPEGMVAQCYCGTPTATARRSSECYQEIWSHPISARGDLVVASICGDASQQNWHALSRALTVAEKLVEPNGAIALCSEIALPLGPSLKRLLDAADLSLLEKKLRRDHFGDSFFALQLSRVLQQHTVYLASSLDAKTVERLGVAPIATDDELGRMIKMHRSCVFLDHAHLLQFESA